MTDGDLTTLGERLRQAREEQALSLQEVEQKTRIRLKFLEALEAGDISVLPSTAHARGFLRNYAQFLNLDAEEILAEFSSLSGLAPRSVTQVSAVPAKTPPPLSRSSASTGAAAPESQPGTPRRVKHIAPAQRVGPAVPRALTDPQPEPLPIQQQEPQQGKLIRNLPVRVLRSNIFAIVVIVLGLVAIAWWATSRLSQISSSDLAAENDSPQVNLDGTPSLTPAPSATYRPTSTPQPEAPVVITDRVVLDITVEQSSWTRIAVDGTVVFEGQLQPGEPRRFEGQREIQIRTGNGAALKINYNGQDIGALGERGEVVERIFTIDGQITPTPAPTITPTATTVPSPTLEITPTP